MQQLFVRHFSTSSFSLRRSLHFFYKIVHPDLTPGFPEIAQNLNKESLSQFNAYVDILERRENEEEYCGANASVPQITLQFFKPYISPSGYSISHRVQPITITLPALRLGATYLEKHAIKLKIIETVEESIQQQSSSFGLTNQPPIPSIFTPKDANKETLAQLWREEVESEMMMSSLFPYLNNPIANKSNEKEVQKIEMFERFVNTRWKRAIRGTNKTKILQRVRKVYKRAQEKIEKHFQDSSSAEVIEKEQQAEQDHSEALRFRALGSHPDMVFLHSSLTEDEAKDARSRLLGRHLSNKSSLWLMYNIWKTLREKPTPIPVIVVQTPCARIYSNNFGELKAGKLRFEKKIHKIDSDVLTCTSRCKLENDLKEKIFMTSKNNNNKEGRSSKTDDGVNTTPTNKDIDLNLSMESNPPKATNIDIEKRLKHWRLKGYDIDFELGFLQIPINFDVWKMADFLEEFLENLRFAREQAVQRLRRTMKS